VTVVPQTSCVPSSVTPVAPTGEQASPEWTNTVAEGVAVSVGTTGREVAVTGVVVAGRTVGRGEVVVGATRGRVEVVETRAGPVVAGGASSDAVAASARGGSTGGRMLFSTVGESSGGAEVIVVEADGVGWPMSPPATSATAMQTRPVRPTPVRIRCVPAHAATGDHHDGRRLRDW
jgi:hypothetical protein